VADLEHLRDGYRTAASEGESIHLSEERWERLACGELSDKEVDAAHDHILTCPQCSDTYRALGILREEASAFDPGAPALTAGSVRKVSSGRRLWGGLGLLAAAAVMMAVVLPTLLPDATDRNGGSQVLRSSGEQPAAVPVSPVDEVMEWRPGTGVVFRWKLDHVAPGVVQILDADGELVWSSPETTATEMTWPAELPPEPGRYFWRVVVTGAGDKKYSSRLESFELSASRP
jgi:hypothetical protein